MSHPWLMGDMESVFNTMKATGRSQFTLEEIQAFVQQASEEAGEAHRKEHPEMANVGDTVTPQEPAVEPVSWAQAAEGLEIPQRQTSQETEIER